MKFSDSFSESQESAALVSSLPGIDGNESGNPMRLFVEILFYLSLLTHVFGWQVGIARVPLLAGFIIITCGAISFVILVASNEKIPMSVYFAIAICSSALVSQSLVAGGSPLGEGEIRKFLWWVSQLTMLCYTVRNDLAAKRVVFFVAMTLTVVIVSSRGFGHGTGTGAYGIERLVSEGTGFTNTNAIGTTASIATGCLLLFSLRTKSFKPCYWVLALIMAYMSVRTLSRLTLVLLAFGIMTFCFATLMGKGGKIAFILLILLAFVAVGKYATTLVEVKQGYESRFEERKGFDRFAGGIDWPSVLTKTAITGVGRETEVVMLGGHSHMTFLHLHVAYGGICAWIYFAWLLRLGIRFARAMISREVLLRHKIEMFAFFGMSFGPQLLSIFAPGQYGIMIAMAMLEKYTAPFSHKNITARMLAEQAQFSEPELSCSFADIQ